MISYKLHLSIGFSGAIHEDTIAVEELGYSDEDWNALSSVDRENELHDVWVDWSNNYIEGGWQEID